ncbi:ATP-dependent 3'-5' DNA helicase [Coemansia sp. RSA 1822]|nr:ATP-dependent 3'-5' DNA helicase [Coemansia sp. RSA 638]KAJ2545585.1 ATP-dependent 3'-5' DNA helicase [Coemansia sp. RSA 1853]KAJ2566535.1 ATP-dependent 3'-5' DNA helicase [Coemansia sp. RSA 1822]
MEHLVQLRKAFTVFATVCVFFGQQSDDLLEFNAIRDSVFRSSKYRMEEDDLAILCGLLGSHIIDIHWDTDSPRLLFSVHAEKIKPQRSAKRARTSKVPNVKLVTNLIDAFNEAVDQIAHDEIGDVLDRLACENMPVRHSIESHVDHEQTVDQFLESLQTASFGGRVVNEATRHFDAVDAQYQDTQHTVDDAVWTALREQRQISRLYAHQAHAIDHVLNGRSVVVSTRTASGKSTIYQIPILQTLLHDPQATFLLLFPTKALAQDQAQSLRAIISCIPALHFATVCTLDGDDHNATHRRSIRDSACIILTNPDTLHTSMLPTHDKWHAFLSQLRVVVVDELHVYQKQFGQHVAHIIARMQRFAQPQFVACSATTSNPVEHMRSLCHVNAELVDCDSAPRGQQSMVLWDSSGPTDIVRIALHLLQSGLRAILFCKHRTECEIVYRELSDLFDTHMLEHLKPRVMSYRGGYTADERRQIEHELFNEQLHVVIATSALELGIDVGGLDVVVMLGTPLSASSLWQQAGRAGRKQQPCAAIVVATQSPLDRQTVRTPCALFDRSFARAHITTEPFIAQAHLQCAAFELPISPTHDTEFAQKLHTTLSQCDLPWDTVTQTWCCSMPYKPWPSLKVPIRSMRTAEWQVVEQPTHAQAARVVEEMDARRAIFTLYEGGILLRRGHTFAIDMVDTSQRVALVSQVDVSWFTRPRSSVTVVPSHSQKTAHVGVVELNHGPVEIASTVVGYTRVDTKTRRVVEYVEHKSPRLTTLSNGVWIDIPLDVTRLVGSNIEACVHAAQHAMLAEISKQTACMPGELGTSCSSSTASDKRPCLVVFETSFVSSGPTVRALPYARTIMHQALARIRDCTCKDGCPDCVLMDTCSENNQHSSKSGALQLLQHLLHD